MGKTIDFLFNLDVAMNNGFSQPLRIMNGEFSRITQTVQNLQKVSGNASAFEYMTASANTNAQKLEELRTRLQATAGAAIDTREGMVTLGARLASARNNYAKLSSSMSKNSPQVKAARQEVKNLQAEYQRAETRAKSLESEQIRLTGQVSKAEGALNSEREKLAALQNELSRAGVNTGNLTEAQKKLTSAIDQAKKAQERFASIRDTLSYGNLKATFMKAAAFTAPIKPMVQVAADFEEAMARVKAVAFTNADADMAMFGKLSAQAEQLGADTKYTAIEAAHAQENLLRANMSPQDVINALPAVLNMASAEGMGIDQASAIIAKGLGGMNLGAELAPRLADILAYTSANSNTNIAMLGEAFKVAAPVLAGQGATMEQVATYLGIMANKGFEGSEAGNAIAAAAMRIAKPTAETTQYLQKLGVATQTRDGKMRTIPSILQALSKSMTDKHWGESQQLAAMSAIFGKNYGKQMMAFMSATAAGDTEKLQAGVYNDSYGRAQKMADINLDTFNGQLAILQSAWSGVQKTVGDMFAPYIRQGIEWLSAGLSNINNIMKEFPGASKIAAGALTAIAGAKVIGGIWNIGKALFSLPGALLELGRAGNEAAKVLGQTPTILQRLSGAFSALGLAIKAHPIIAIGTLAAGAVTLALMHSDKLKAWWNNFVIPDIWNPLVAKANSVIEALKGLWESFKTWILEKFTSLNPFNWELPGWLKAAGGSSTQQVSNANIALGGYQPPEIKAYATGGIVTQPQFATIAENGPEAVIPLNDKSRGLPLLQVAANSLGAENFGERIIPVNTSSSTSTSNYSPTINITVNSNSEEPQSLAQTISQYVAEALANISNWEDRVSYA